MISLKKIKFYIVSLGISGFLFSIINPSIDIAILVSFFWYAYLWKKEFSYHKLKFFKGYVGFAILGTLIVIVRTIIFNI